MKNQTKTNGETNRILSEVAASLQKKLTFTFVIPDGEEHTDGPCIGVTVNFKGPFIGRLVLRMPETLPALLAENMLAITPEEDDSEETRYDAARELANVICGNLLPKIAGAEAVFNLQAPTIVKDEECLRKEISEDAAHVRLFLEEGWLEVFLDVAGEI